jgi:hypothetical protein
VSSTPGLGTGLYSTSSLKVEDFIDDSALDNALSDDEDGLESFNLGEQLSKIDSAPPSEVPPREGLYSTPLSWEKPQPGLRMDPLMGLGGLGALGGIGSVGSLAGFGGPIMDQAEQRRLLAIAMNTSRTPTGFTSAFTLPLVAGFGSGFASSLAGSVDSNIGTTSLSEISKVPDIDALKTKKEPKEVLDMDSAFQTPPRPQISRTNTGTTDKGKEKVKPGGDRTAHNDIERKYRTNLKDKIAELRDAVPSLRSIPEEGEEEDEGSSQPNRAPKVSKVSVISCSE